MRVLLGLAGAASLALIGGAEAKEYFVGGPVHEHDMDFASGLGAMHV